MREATAYYLDEERHGINPLNRKYINQRFKEAGFVLWDKVFNQLQTPFGSTNWERNYINKYCQKNYEVNLVFMKFN